jgi:hypothetical protein
MVGVDAPTHLRFILELYSTGLNLRRAEDLKNLVRLGCTAKGRVDRS